jgi:hypothetical protein
MSVAMEDTVLGCGDAPFLVSLRKDNRHSSTYLGTEMDRDEGSKEQDRVAKLHSPLPSVGGQGPAVTSTLQGFPPYRQSQVRGAAAHPCLCLFHSAACWLAEGRAS